MTKASGVPSRNSSRLFGDNDVTTSGLPFSISSVCSFFSAFSDGLFPFLALEQFQVTRNLMLTRFCFCWNSMSVVFSYKNSVTTFNFEIVYGALSTSCIAAKVDDTFQCIQQSPRLSFVLDMLQRTFHFCLKWNCWKQPICWEELSWVAL